MKRRITVKEFKTFLKSNSADKWNEYLTIDKVEALQRELHQYAESNGYIKDKRGTSYIYDEEGLESDLLSRYNSVNEYLIEKVIHFAIFMLGNNSTVISNSAFSVFQKILYLANDKLKREVDEITSEVSNSFSDLPELKEYITQFVIALSEYTE